MESIIGGQLITQVLLHRYLKYRKFLSISRSSRLHSNPSQERIGDHLDNLLSNHATKESCNVGQLGKSCSSTDIVT
jgi:hypothetical protein